MTAHDLLLVPWEDAQGFGLKAAHEAFPEAKDIGIVIGPEGGMSEDEVRALEELDVASPLKEVGMGKDEIRAISKRLGLPTWDKPSFSCLMTRFAYGEYVDARKLDMVGKAELLLLDEGFHQLRVRYHEGDIARIELNPKEFAHMFEDGRNLRVESALRKLGFAFVTLDLGGYATGKMNADEEQRLLSEKDDGSAGEAE